MMEASLFSIDDFSTAFDDSQFRAYYKETFSKTKWCNMSECNARQKDLIGRLCRAEERSQSILMAENVRGEWNQYMSNRKLIKDVFIELLRHEMKFCRQHNVEQHFWKILYYNLIECARRILAKKSNSSNHLHQRQLCFNLIEDGRHFFCQILDMLAKHYRYVLDDFIGVHGGQNLRGLKYISLALVSAQKCLMYLGDLMRYRELINDSSNFREAEQWYRMSYELIPSNGMSWNQLAILALYNKKNFNAIFYHMRSLNASNPIKSARESLIILFDELHKRYQSQSAMHQKLSTQQQKQQQHQQRQHSSSSAKRNRNENVKREIWFHPTDGQLNYRTVYLDQDNESMDANDLYKKFIFNFSHLHGVFFTKVGVDTLEQCMDQTLKQFQELLNHSLNTSSILTQRKMIQIIILNGYSIENDVQSANDTLLAFVINFSFTFIAIILNQLQFELNEMAATKTINNSNVKPLNITEINDFNISDDINKSLAALSMWCNWMKINWNVWTSDAFLMEMHKYTEQYGLYIWDDFARLATVLENFNYNFDAQIVVQNEPMQNCGEQFKRIRLPEDMIALGMTSVVRSDFCYCSNKVNEKNAFSLLRLQNIRHFCENDLMNEECAFLHRLDFGEIVATQIHRTDEDSNDGCNLSMASISINDADLSQESVGFGSSSTKDDNNDDYSVQQPNPSSDEVKILLQRRNELKQTHQIQHELNKYTQNIVQQSSSQNICIEIRPKYLITDTNCFIDFLPQIKQLSHAYPMYNVLIPIVVLNELEGLAKGECGSNVYDTPKKTSLNAHEALTFLKNAGSCIKCVTTRGSILQSMTFTKESDCATTVEGHTEPLSNDDKILLTAVNLTKIHSNSMSRDPKPINLSNLQRKVVLLTNDRNLKLKAIAQNIPVRELIDFIKWSNIVK